MGGGGGSLRVGGGWEGNKRPHPPPPQLPVQDSFLWQRRWPHFNLHSYHSMRHGLGTPPHLPPPPPCPAPPRPARLQSPATPPTASLSPAAGPLALTASPSGLSSLSTSSTPSWHPPSCSSTLHRRLPRPGRWLDSWGRGDGEGERRCRSCWWRDRRGSSDSCCGQRSGSGRAGFG